MVNMVLSAVISGAAYFAMSRKEWQETSMGHHGRGSSVLSRHGALPPNGLGLSPKKYETLSCPVMDHALVVRDADDHGQFDFEGTEAQRGSDGDGNFMYPSGVTDT